MNLHDCGVVYFALPEALLYIKTKIYLQAALSIYRSKSTSLLEDESSNGRMTAYQRRSRSEIRRELLQAGVLREVDGGWLQLLPLDMEEDRSIAKDRIVIPSKIDFSALSFTALKVLLVLYSLNRYSRTPFRLNFTQAELARDAGVGARRLGGALSELVTNRLVAVEKQWKSASKITLLEPESGVELYYLGDFYRKRKDAIAVHWRYVELLQRFDPRDHLKDVRSPVTGYTLHCPFCRRGMTGEPSFRFDSTDEGDHWTCFRCKRSGNSARLWAKMEPWFDKTDWRQMIADCTAQEGKSHVD